MEKTKKTMPPTPEPWPLGGDAPKSFRSKAFGWIPAAFKTAVEYAETTMVLLYIFNGVAAFLILFGLVDSSTTFDKIVGCVAFSFSVFALIAFINKGVKHQSSTKKGKK